MHRKKPARISKFSVSDSNAKTQSRFAVAAAVLPLLFPLKFFLAHSSSQHQDDLSAMNNAEDQTPHLEQYRLHSLIKKGKFKDAFNRIRGFPHLAAAVIPDVVLDSTPESNEGIESQMENLYASLILHSHFKQISDSHTYEDDFDRGRIKSYQTELDRLTEHFQHKPLAVEALKGVERLFQHEKESVVPEDDEITYFCHWITQGRFVSLFWDLEKLPQLMNHVTPEQVLQGVRKLQDIPEENFNPSEYECAISLLHPVIRRFKPDEQNRMLCEYPQREDLKCKLVSNAIESIKQTLEKERAEAKQHWKKGKVAAKQAMRDLQMERRKDSKLHFGK